MKSLIIVLFTSACICHFVDSRSLQIVKHGLTDLEGNSMSIESSEEDDRRQSRFFGVGQCSQFAGMNLPQCQKPESESIEDPEPESPEQIIVTVSDGNSQEQSEPESESEENEYWWVIVCTMWPHC